VLKARQNIRNLSTLSGFRFPLALVTGVAPPPVFFPAFQASVVPTVILFPDKTTIGGECGEKKKALGLDWLSAFYL
jgi:hypothetical protein